MKRKPSNILSEMNDEKRNVNINHSRQQNSILDQKIVNWNANGYCQTIPKNQKSLFNTTSSISC